MTYRLLALNIDGTLLKENARISRQTKEAIAYVRKKGVYVTLATSRPFPSARKVAKSLKLDGYLITSDGSFIAHSADEPLFTRRIKEEKAMQIVDILENFDCQIRVMHETYSIGNRVRQKSNLMAKMTIGVEDPPFYPATFVESLTEQMMKKPVAPQKINVQFFDTMEKNKAMQQIEKMVRGIEINELDENKFDFISQGISKANGLQILGRHLGIKAKEMVAVGSTVHDSEMIAQVGLGVAMGNSPESVKEVADWLTRSNEQNGVSYMIREVFRKQLRIQI